MILQFSECFKCLYIVNRVEQIRYRYGTGMGMCTVIGMGTGMSMSIGIGTGMSIGIGTGMDIADYNLYEY